MPHRRFLVLGLVIATSLAILPCGAASAASPEGGTIVTVELDLKTSNGLLAHLSTADDETVTLEIGRKTNQVIYEVKGQVTETGLRAKFGRLGLIDVAFTPTRVLSSTEPSEGCAGAPRTLREGTFAGTIEFTGERRYVRLEGPQATGEMSVISQWDCPEPVDTRFGGGAGPLARERREATLYAATQSCKCLFAAGVHLGRKNSRSTFYGLREESREGMQITRFLLVKGPTSAFVADFEKGTVTMRPPKPFSGRATLVARPKARDRWRGTIRIPLLGLKPLKLSGPAVRAIVVDEYHFDTE